MLDLCSRCFHQDLDTFQSDPNWQAVAGRAIFKGTRRFYEILELVCGLLVSLPHEQSFSLLVIGQMRGYYDRCFDWSKGLLQRVVQENGGESVKIRLAADLATSGDVSETVIEISKLHKDSSADDEAVEKEKMVLAEKESELLLRLIKQRGELEDAELILDRKALAALCTLHVSMKWLAAKCSALRYVSPRAVDTANSQQNGSQRESRRWTAELTLQAGNGLPGASQGPYLPCDQQTATQFDAVISSFTELSTLVLRTLHIDFRLHILQGVYKAMDTTYALSQPYNDPDPSILDLSNSLNTYDAQLSTHILKPQYAFLTSNLHILVNNALVSLISSIPAMDTYGNARMSLNILVLQQSLKSLQPDADLNKAARFYELGAQGPEAVIKEGSKEGYAVEDLKALVRLCWDEERDRELGDVESMAAKLGGWPTRKTSLKGRGTSGRGRGAGVRSGTG